MKSKLSEEQVLGIIRHVLTFAGGLLVTKGVLSDGMSQEIIGGVITLVGAIWSIVSKNNPTPPTPLSGTTS